MAIDFSQHQAFIQSAETDAERVAREFAVDFSEATNEGDTPVYGFDPATLLLIAQIVMALMPMLKEKCNFGSADDVVDACNSGPARRVLYRSMLGIAVRRHASEQFDGIGRLGHKRRFLSDLMSYSGTKPEALVRVWE